MGFIHCQVVIPDSMGSIARQCHSNGNKNVIGFDNVHVHLPQINLFLMLDLFTSLEQRQSVILGVANGIRKIKGLGNFCSNLEISEAF